MTKVGWLGTLLLAGCTMTGPSPADLGNSPDLAPAGKPPAPTTLRSFESNAEGISDASKVADWVKAQSIFSQAQATWNNLKPAVTAAGASAMTLKAIDDTLAKTQTDLTAHSQRASETDANTVSLAVPDLFDLFSFPVPSDVLRGDGVFRQLQIEAEYSDWTMAATDQAAVKQVWARVRPLVVTRAPMRTDIPGASTVVADLDAAVIRGDAALGAHDSAGLQKAAQDGLDLVDVCEQIFK